MYQPTPADRFHYLLNQAEPRAIAWIQGNTSYPQVAGYRALGKRAGGEIPVAETDVDGIWC